MAGRRHPEPRGFIMGPSTPRVDRERPKHAQASDSLPAHNTHNHSANGGAAINTPFLGVMGGDFKNNFMCIILVLYSYLRP